MILTQQDIIQNVNLLKKSLDETIIVESQVIMPHTLLWQILVITKT